MTTSASARCCPGNSAGDRALAAVRRCPRHASRRTAANGERGEISPDARRMSTSTVACYRFTAPVPKQPQRKATPQSLLVTAAVTGLVIGCGWTLYVNIFAASPYPELGSASFDAPVIRPFADRFADAAVRTAALPQPPVISVPETVPADPALSFVDRFAASSPEGVAPAPVPEAPTRIAVAPKPEPLKLAEAPKFQLASASPAAQPDDQPKSKFSEMAQRAKNAILGLASSDRKSMVEKL